LPQIRLLPQFRQQRLVLVGQVCDRFEREVRVRCQRKIVGIKSVGFEAPEGFIQPRKASFRQRRQG